MTKMIEKEERMETGIITEIINWIKNHAIGVVVGAIVVSVVITLSVVGIMTRDKSTEYVRDMKVVEVGKDVLLLEDINGDLWEVEKGGEVLGGVSYWLNDTMMVTLNDNGTSYTIYDDIIIDTKPLVKGAAGVGVGA